MWRGKFPVFGIPAERSNPCPGVTPADATDGQFLVALHEVGHAVFDIFEVSVFGRAEDAADIMLQFGKEQARRLIGGAAWAWRRGITRRIPCCESGYLILQVIMVCPKERFYNLLCRRFVPTRCYSLMRSPNCELNTVHWSMRSIRKSARISIRKWQGGC
jgi:hypothetical protein